MYVCNHTHTYVFIYFVLVVFTVDIMNNLNCCFAPTHTRTGRHTPALNTYTWKKMKCANIERRLFLFFNFLFCIICRASFFCVALVYFSMLYFVFPYFYYTVFLFCCSYPHTLQWHKQKQTKCWRCPLALTLTAATAAAAVAVDASQSQPSAFAKTKRTVQSPQSRRESRERERERTWRGAPLLSLYVDMCVCVYLLLFCLYERETGRRK